MGAGSESPPGISEILDKGGLIGVKSPSNLFKFSAISKSIDKEHGLSILSTLGLN